ncbi:SAM-dependent methyltransferase, partial [bacterium]|nr:SAM-dependent methyltransferase [bacterium]
PWFSYPAIEWIKHLDLSRTRIFEYGSGNSTIFWAKRCKEIFSVENNPKWYKKISIKLIKYKNATLILEKNQRKYINMISKTNKKFDIVIIDGAHRKSCAKKASKHIKKSGMVILDNADWFPNTSKMLRKQNLKQIDFIGFGPINYYATNTAVFIKNGFLSRITYTASPSFVQGGLKNLDD